MAAWRRKHLFPRSRQPCARTGHAGLMAGILAFPSPLVGEGREGGREATRGGRRLRETSRPPPLPFPTRGEGLHYARPYTGTTAPRVTRFSGDARNMIVADTSSTFGHSS